VWYCRSVAGLACADKTISIARDVSACAESLCVNALLQYCNTARIQHTLKHINMNPVQDYTPSPPPGGAPAVGAPTYVQQAAPQQPWYQQQQAQQQQTQQQAPQPQPQPQYQQQYEQLPQQQQQQQAPQYQQQQQPQASLQQQVDRQQPTPQQQEQGGQQQYANQPAPPPQPQVRHLPIARMPD